VFYDSLPTGSAGRAELPQGVAGAIHDLAGRQKGPFLVGEHSRALGPLKPVGAENVIRPSGEGRCISRPIVSHRRTTVAHLVRPRVGSCVCAATNVPAHRQDRVDPLHSFNPFILFTGPDEVFGTHRFVDRDPVVAAARYRQHRGVSRFELRTEGRRATTSFG
jgi:hypothetical protein